MYIFQYLLIYDIIIFVMRERYIEKRIRKNLIKSIVLPILFIGVLIDALLLLNLKSVSKPAQIKDIWTYMEDMEGSSIKGKYIQTTINDLNYTGFDLTKSGKRAGAFYYTIKDSKCILVLVNASENDKIANKLDKYTCKCKILKSGSLNTELLNNIANQISWDPEDLKGNISEYVLSEPDFSISRVYSLAVFITVLLAITLAYIAYKIMLMVNPHMLPRFNVLNRYGNKKSILRSANIELSNHVIEYLNNAYITENYFIDLSKLKPIILPLKDIDTCKYGNRRKRKSTIYVRMSHGDTYKIYDRTYSDFKRLKETIWHQNNA